MSIQHFRVSRLESLDFLVHFSSSILSCIPNLPYEKVKVIADRYNLPFHIIKFPLKIYIKSVRKENEQNIFIRQCSVQCSVIIIVNNCSRKCQEIFLLISTNSLVHTVLLFALQTFTTLPKIIFMKCYICIWQYVKRYKILSILFLFLVCELWFYDDMAGGYLNNNDKLK